jgi:2-oxoacid:acceptor oxidoreductase gamma subunit (pyruvate/2-ketoisovalerate family)
LADNGDPVLAYVSVIRSGNEKARRKLKGEEGGGIPHLDHGSLHAIRRRGILPRRSFQHFQSPHPQRIGPLRLEKRVRFTKENPMRELRIHGRGGQGAVIASKLLASALFHEGRSVQSFPAFGVERRGAPVTAFLRFSDGPILLRCEITEPDDLIVLDPTLVTAIDVSSGLKAKGSILINSDRRPADYPELVRRFRVGTVDASAIARKYELGSKTQPIVNTAILGAFAAFSGLVTLDAICAAIEEDVPIRTDANVRAAREAARAVNAATLLEV